MIDQIFQLQHDILSAAFSMEYSHHLGQTTNEALNALRHTGICFEELSIYLKTNAGKMIHYYLHPLPAGWRQHSEDDAEKVCPGPDLERPTVWREESAHWLRIPTVFGTLLLRRNETSYSEAEVETLHAVAKAIMMIGKRHQELVEKEANQPIVENPDEKLLALHDEITGLFHLSQQEIFEQLIHLATQTLGFDRCGISLKDEARGILQGRIGVDQQGKLEDISAMVFPLVASAPEETTVMCQVATGDRPYFLTQDLDGEGYRSKEGDISSNAVVPMKLGQEIIGVLCVDNYLSRKPIPLSELPALMVLANQGANALSSLASNEKERYHSMLLSQLSEAVISTDLGGKIRIWNAGAEHTYGWDASEMINRHISQLCHPDCGCPSGWESIDGGASGKSCEIRRLTRTGKEIWVSLTLSPIHNFAGEVIGYVETSVDITQRRKAGAALRKSNKQLEETLAKLKESQQQVVQNERLCAVGQMSSGIAHDFNNSLSTVLGYAEMLLIRPEELANEEKTVRRLQLIKSAAQDAAHVVRRLREFYRHRDEREVFEPIDLNEIIEQVVLITQPKWKTLAQAEGRTIQIQTELRQTPTMNGSRTEIREVLTNLIFNAVDAMPNGGTIKIGTRVDANGVCLEVSDTGVGMDENVRRRCLEPFFTTKGDLGTGLGLSMVHGIVRRHGGAIDIDTAAGRGTRFVICLPAQAAEEVAYKSAPQAAPMASLHVLVVEDEAMVRDVVAAYLTSDGHTIETAKNGREGLTKFHAGQFDLVVTDQAMPEMNGEQLATAIRKIAPTKHIIMLTGFGELMKAKGEEPKGIDLVLSKPITLDAFREALSKVTPNASLANSSHNSIGRLSQTYSRIPADRVRA